MLQRASPVALQSEQFFLSTPIKKDKKLVEEIQLDKRMIMAPLLSSQKQLAEYVRIRCVEDYNLTGSAQLCTQLGRSHFM